MDDGHHHHRGHHHHGTGVRQCTVLHRMQLADRSQREWLEIVIWLDELVGKRGREWEITKVVSAQRYEIGFLREEDLVRFKLTWM